MMPLAAQLDESRRAACCRRPGPPRRRRCRRTAAPARTKPAAQPAAAALQPPGQRQRAAQRPPRPGRAGRAAGRRPCRGGRPARTRRAARRRRSAAKRQQHPPAFVRERAQVLPSSRAATARTATPSRRRPASPTARSRKAGPSTASASPLAARALSVSCAATAATTANMHAGRTARPSAKATDAGARQPGGHRPPPIRRDSTALAAERGEQRRGRAAAYRPTTPAPSSSCRPVSSSSRVCRTTMSRLITATSAAREDADLPGGHRADRVAVADRRRTSRAARGCSLTVAPTGGAGRRLYGRAVAAGGADGDRREDVHPDRHA